MLNFGIYTLNDNENFGNRLQNYAVQYIFSKYGNVYNLQPRFPDLKTRLKYDLWKTTNGSIERIFRNKNYRIYRAIEFNKGLNYKKKNTDFYIYGSDQIWNPYYAEEFLINPTTPKEKNIAFCASFGISEIPQKYDKLFSEGLNHFGAISVREEAGADIVRKYTGKRPVVLLDPTMYVPARHWRKIEKFPQWLRTKKYVLLYFLGELSKERMKMIEEYAGVHSVEIVDLSTVEFSGKTSPDEFLYLIDNADYVVTDSFHGSVFSILFHTPFSVMSRSDKDTLMKSRTETLLNKFGLQNHFVSENGELCMGSDYSRIQEILEKERKKTDAFITKAMGMEKN